jgi:hypothetical protein
MSLTGVSVDPPTGSCDACCEPFECRTLGVGSVSRAGMVDLRTGDSARDDPAASRAWGSERIVRAEVIAALLLGVQAAEPGRVPVLKLFGARIIGVLDLSFADVAHSMLLRHCRFDAELRLHGIHSRSVNLSGSCLPGLDLSDSQIDGQLWLEHCLISGH